MLIPTEYRPLDLFLVDWEAGSAHGQCAVAMASSTVPVPRAGCSYPINLGKSFQRAHVQDDFVTVRYKFRPSTTSRARTGSLVLQSQGIGEESAPIRVRRSHSLIS
jgi:RNA polymerase II transcription elongation factor